MAPSETKLDHCKNALEEDIGTLDPSSPFLLGYQTMNRSPSQQTPAMIYYATMGPVQEGQVTQAKTFKTNVKLSHFPS